MNYQRAVSEILYTAKLLKPDKAEVESVFRTSGIKVTPDLMFQSFMGNPHDCICTLMSKLEAMPVVRVSAKRVLRNEGFLS